MNCSQNLSLSTWNQRCEFEISKTYLKHLAAKSTIIAVQEHGLFKCELLKLRTVLKGYDGFGKSSARLSNDGILNRKGIGGCG